MSGLQRVLKRIDLPYWLLLPSILFMLVFFVMPLVQVFLLSIRAEDGSLTLVHFQRMINDVYFARALKNTFWLTVIVVPAQLVLAMTIALIINRKLRGSMLYLAIYAIPMSISDLASGLIWLSIFTERGYLNAALLGAGLIDRAVIYLSHQSPQWLLTALVISEIWRATPLVMLILLAGLQMIAKDYLEAADTFGATPWQRFRLVILPLLRPSIQTALVIRTMLALQVFSPVVVLTGRLYPVLASESYFWYELIRNERVASAYALTLTLLSIVITWGYLVFLRSKEEQIGVV